LKNKYSWPNEAKAAATISVLLEVWADGKWPSYFPRTTALKPGMEDVSASRWSSFGIKEGVYRLLAALRRNDLRATFFMNAIVAEREPKLIKEVMDSGHSIAAHGYSQDQFLMSMSPDEQRDIIKRCVSLLKGATGKHPEGWVTSVYSWTDETHALLAQEGFKWHADALDASLPRREKHGKGSIIALPWCDFVDNRVLRASPLDYSETYESVIRHTCEHEPLGLINVGMHCHFGGRPLMGESIEKVLRCLKNTSGLWNTTHSEVAEWFESQKVDSIDNAALFGVA
jgi:allantoinase